jgi:Mn-dependent DtxR family transcriptional regulator
MSLNALSNDDIVKLRSFFTEGSQVLGDIEALKEGLTETTKALAAELDVKPGELTAALKIHHKQSLIEHQDKMTTIETILEAAGK